MPNLAASISGHNKKILEEEERSRMGGADDANCNCLKSYVADCPIPGQCNSNGVVYQASVESNDGRKETYVGLAINFKNRYGNHKSSMKIKDEKRDTTLSAHYWKEKEAGKEPKVSWVLLDKGLEDYNPTSGICNLCVREKYFILFEPDKSSLNSRQEIFGFCRHKEAKLLKKPPDRKREGS